MREDQVKGAALHQKGGRQLDFSATTADLANGERVRAQAWHLLAQVKELECSGQYRGPAFSLPE